MQVSIKNNTFALFPEKAAYWIEKGILLISDLHIGKVSHFRKAGIAVPLTASDDNFRRLDALVEACSPERILFTGDLFHSDVNHEWQRFCEWRSAYSGIGMEIVLGNHDRLPPTFCSEFDITIHEKETHIGPFTFVHHPRERFKKQDRYCISGHIHPMVLLSGKANQRMRLPCFYFGERQAVLPSFGSFTGGHPVAPVKGDTIIAIAGNRLVNVSGPRPQADAGRST